MKSQIQHQKHTLTCHHQGAHVSSWIFNDREQLFLSKSAIFQEGVAIRGGVPICFPQFGAFGPGQKHGFARNVDWKLITHEADCLRFGLSRTGSDIDSDYSFSAVFGVRVENNELQMSLNVENTDTETFEFTSALHTYFQVDEITEIKIAGLEGLSYWDNGDDFSARSIQEDKCLEVHSAIDRVYFNSIDALILEEKDQSRIISASGFKDTVVWNPWFEGAKSLKDMQDNEYKNMICIEAANVEQAVTLKPGESWQGEQRIRIKE